MVAMSEFERSPASTESKKGPSDGRPCGPVLQTSFVLMKERKPSNISLVSGQPFAVCPSVSLLFYLMFQVDGSIAWPHFGQNLAS